MLAGSALGYWGGQRLAARVPHSSGDVEATVVTAGLGAYSACALVALADIEQHRAYSAAAAAGLVAGGWLGEDRFAGQELSTDQARLALLGAGGGLLLGVATHLVVAPDAKTVAPLLSALGADTGFWLVGRAVARPRGTKSAAARVGLGPAVMRADRGRGQAAIVPALRATWVLR